MPLVTQAELLKVSKASEMDAIANSYVHMHIYASLFEILEKIKARSAINMEKPPRSAEPIPSY